MHDEDESMNREELLDIITCFGSAGTSNYNYKLGTAIAWIRCLQQGKSPINRLREMGIDEIIIYGITELGGLLVNEAVLKGYKVLGITDRKVGCGGYFFQDIPVINRKELDDYRDRYIVVTSMAFWEEIVIELGKQGYQHIVALRELM